MLGRLHAQSPCFYANGYDPAASRIRACAPFTIEMVDCTGGGLNLAYRFTADGTRTNNPTFTYTQPGVYSITQYGNFPDDEGGFTGDSLTKVDYVEILPTPPLHVQWIGCAGRQLSLLLPESPYEQYLIDWGDGSPIDVALPGSTQQHIYPTAGNYTVQLRAEYLLNRIDEQNCGRDTTFSLLIYDSIAELNFGFQATAIQPRRSCQGEVQLRWEQTRPDWYYQVEVSQNGSPFEVWQVFDRLVGEEVELYWNGNTLSQSLQFRLTISDSCGSSRIETTPLITPPFSALPLYIADFRLSYNHTNQLAGSWKDAEASYPELTWLQLFENNQPKTSLPNNGAFLIDDKPIQAACWQLRADTPCGELANSAVVCPIQLQLSTTGRQRYHLSWRPYQVDGQTPNQHYRVVVSTVDGTQLQAIDVGTQTEYLLNFQDTTQQVVHIYVEGTIANQWVSQSNRQRIEQAMQLHFPTAFTPNGDGLNDFFMPKGAFVARYRLQIFDSRGSLLFESKDLHKGWDGGNAPAGGYLYKAMAEDFAGRQQYFEGMFILIR